MLRLKHLAGAARISRRGLSVSPVFGRYNPTSSQLAPLRHSSGVVGAAQSPAKTQDPDDEPVHGLSPEDVFPEANQRRAELLATLNPPLFGQPKAAKVLVVANKFPRIPLAHTDQVSDILSKHYTQNAAPLEDIPTIMRIMVDCCLLPSSGDGPPQPYKTSTLSTVTRFSSWLFAESTRRADKDGGKRLDTLLDAFEAQLTRHASASGLSLSPAYAAVWAVLRTRAGRTGGVSIDGLKIPLARRAIAMAKQMDLNLAECEGAINEMCLSMEAMPTTIESLRRLLGYCTNVAELEKLWTEYLALPEDHRLKAQRDASLAEFTFFARKQRTVTVEQREAYAKLAKDIAPHFSKPLPLPVLHSLLSTESTMAIDETPADMAAGPKRKEVQNRRDQVVAEAAESWKNFIRDGGKPDTKAYLLYASFLGKYHRTTALYELWDEMVHDKVCKAAHQKEVRAKAGDETIPVPWPPTIVLNQILSASYTIGSTAAEMAKQLYKLSLEPDSPIAANIVTINTTLRFAAHLANIPMMNETMADAAKAKLEPDIVTYTSLVQGLLRADRVDLARKILDAMRARGIEPNERMAAMLVADLAKSGSASGLRRAEDVIRDMRARGIKTTVAMWTALIAGYFGGGWNEDGISALGRMRKSGVTLNSVGYHIVMKQCMNSLYANPISSQDQCEIASKTAYMLFCSMLDDNVAPTSDTYTILIQGLSRPVRMHPGYSTYELTKVLEDIDRRGFQTSKQSLGGSIERARDQVARSRSGGGGRGGERNAQRSRRR